MINLLPPTHKEQINYAKLNRRALKYFRGILLMMVVLGAVFGASIYLINQHSAELARDVADKKQEIKSYEPKVKLAKDAAARLTALKGIKASQTRFSLLLDDLAKVLPKGVSIDSITLTGDDKKPVRITITSTTYNAVLAFRESLAASARVSGVDLENLQQAGPGVFTAAVVIGFKPGQAR